MTSEILRRAEALKHAEAALERNKGFVPEGALIRAEPACPEACPTCTLRCAIIWACVQTSRRLLSEAMADAGPTLSHGGRFYVTTEGMA
jgi:hypothetical protein